MTRPPRQILSLHKRFAMKDIIELQSGWKIPSSFFLEQLT